MNIVKQMNGKNLEIAVEGALDTYTSPELGKVLEESMGGADTLTLDFSKLEYISSAGLRVLLFAQNAMEEKGGMKIKNVSEIIRDAFEITGFMEILTIE